MHPHFPPKWGGKGASYSPKSTVNNVHAVKWAEVRWRKIKQEEECTHSRDTTRAPVLSCLPSAWNYTSPYHEFRFCTQWFFSVATHAVMSTSANKMIKYKCLLNLEIKILKRLKCCRNTQPSTCNETVTVRYKQPGSEALQMKLWFSRWLLVICWTWLGAFHSTRLSRKGLRSQRVSEGTAGVVRGNSSLCGNVLSGRHTKYLSPPPFQCQNGLQSQIWPSNVHISMCCNTGPGSVPCPGEKHLQSSPDVSRAWRTREDAKTGRLDQAKEEWVLEQKRTAGVKQRKPENATV